MNDERISDYLFSSYSAFFKLQLTDRNDLFKIIKETLI